MNDLKMMMRRHNSLSSLALPLPPRSVFLGGCAFAAPSKDLVDGVLTLPEARLTASELPPSPAPSLAVILP